MFPSNYIEYKPLAEAAFKEWTPEAKVVYKSLQGGYSGAAVLKVDVREVQRGKINSGQYIVKINKYPQWNDTPDEASAHQHAYDWNEHFSKKHITNLIAFEDFKDLGGYVLLYEIAGASMDSYITTDTPESSHFMEICDQVVTETLLNWAEAEPKEDNHPHEFLEKWLGYRLDPNQATAFHTFVEAKMGKDFFCQEGGEIILNPLRFHELLKLAGLSKFGCINSLLHGDLHGGNILVHRQFPRENPFWLIDFGLSKINPVGFDQAYLEMAQIIYCLGSRDPALLIGILKQLRNGGAQEILPSGTYWTFDCLKRMRNAINEWRVSTHPRRLDDVNRQLCLARIAAGLNWANKPLAEPHRYLALCYAGWSAREYLEVFEPSTWQSIVSNRGAPLPTPKFSDEVPTSDDVLWEELWQSVGGFSSRHGKFILLTEAQDLIDPKRLGAIGQLPWSAAIDLDPYSDSRGLYKHVEPVLHSHRGLHIFSHMQPVVDYSRGTAWMMAAGWALKHEVPTDLSTWVYDKLQLIRDFIKNIDNHINPDPVFVIVLPGGSLDETAPMSRLSKVVGAIDEVMRGRAKIILLGRREITDQVKYSLIPLDVEIFLRYLENKFGHRARSSVAQIPGQDGDWCPISLDVLRTLQENVNVLHSNILEETTDQDNKEQGSFWRGHPPTWADLHAAVDIKRSIHDELIETLRSRLEETRNYTVILHHHPGAGGTTAAYRAAWDLHWEFPVIILSRWSAALSTRIQNLYSIVHRTILLVADASDLTETHREDLHRDLAQNNTPAVLLYIRRGFQKKSEFPLSLDDPMEEDEAQEFYKAYQVYTEEKRRRQELDRITNERALSRYRTPFFYGLITFEHDFVAVDRYVASHLKGVRGKPRDILEYLALVTIYSNTGLHQVIIKQILGLSGNTELTMSDLFGEGPARLFSSRQGRIRLLHQVIAEEVLSDLARGGSADWRLELDALAKDFIRDVTISVNPDSQEILDLFRQIFIDRYGIDVDYFEDRPNFSPLIEEIDSIDKSLGHRVLETLTSYSPNGSHFWNHLGRHQVYRMRRDVDKAEEYLQTAINLSPNDPVHYHTFGVVIRSRIREVTRSMIGKSGIEILNSVAHDFRSAVEAFEQARKIDPENVYAYITHIQLILELAESLRNTVGVESIGQINQENRIINDWIHENISTAQKLLAEVELLYGTLDLHNTYVTKCYADLQKLYGDIDQVIRIWELADARGSSNANSRRSLANAYWTRNEWHWSNMQVSELRRIVDLMEQNFRSSGRRDDDYRLWFEAYKLLPEFDVEEALAKLRLWASQFPSWRAYYYTYILHFHLWFSGRTDSVGEMEAALEQCQNLAIGRKTFSYHWYGHAPTHCPLVSSSDLTWSKKENFWEDFSLLKQVNGIIEDPIQGPQAGWIQIDGRAKAFFVPGASNFSAHRDENSPVNFFIGFSPMGLRAWKPDREHTADGNRIKVGEPTPMIVPRRIKQPLFSESAKLNRIKSLKDERIKQFISDLVTAKSELGADLTIKELEDRLEATFGIDKILEQMDVQSIQDLAKGIENLSVILEAKNAYIVNADVFQRRQKEVETRRQSVTSREGHISFYNSAKKYGFIEDESQKKRWFSKSYIVPESRGKMIFSGQSVHFIPDIDEEGRPIAVGIKLLDENKVAFGRLSKEKQPQLSQEVIQLRENVMKRTIELVQDAHTKGENLKLESLAIRLANEFLGKGKLSNRLGYKKFSQFLEDNPKLEIYGEDPLEKFVRLRS